MRTPSQVELASLHRRLDTEIKKLERRGARMTPHERDHAAALKRRKLWLRDQLSGTSR